MTQGKETQGRFKNKLHLVLHWQLENDPPTPFFPSLLPQFVCISSSSPLLWCLTLRNKAAPPLSLTQHPLSPSRADINDTAIWGSSSSPALSFSPLQATRTHTLLLLTTYRCGQRNAFTHTPTRVCFWSSRRTGSYAHLSRLQISERWGLFLFAFVPVSFLQPPWCHTRAMRWTCPSTRTRGGMRRDRTLWDLNLAALPPAPSSWDHLVSAGAPGPERRTRTAHTSSLCHPSPSSCPNSSGCWRKRWRSSRAWRRWSTSWRAGAKTAGGLGATVPMDISKPTRVGRRCWFRGMETKRRGRRCQVHPAKRSGEMGWQTEPLWTLLGKDKVRLLAKTHQSRAICRKCRWGNFSQYWFENVHLI